MVNYNYLTLAKEKVNDFFYSSYAEIIWDTMAVGALIMILVAFVAGQFIDNPPTLHLGPIGYGFLIGMKRKRHIGGGVGLISGTIISLMFSFVTGN